MDKICKNCDHKLTGKFCAYCGQEDIPNPIKYWDFIKVFLSNAYLTEKKFYHTVKNLFRPGFLTVEFLTGKQIPYKHPMTMFYSLLTIGIIVYLNLYQPVRRDYTEHLEHKITFTSVEKNKDEIPPLQLDQFIQNQIKLGYLLTLPITSLFIFLLYGRTLIIFEKSIIFAINWGSINILTDTLLYLVVYILHYLMNKDTIAITDKVLNIIAAVYSFIYFIYGVKFIFDSSLKQAIAKSTLILCATLTVIIIIITSTYWIFYQN